MQKRTKLVNCHTKEANKQLNNIFQTVNSLKKTFVSVMTKPNHIGLTRDGKKKALMSHNLTALGKVINTKTGHVLTSSIKSEICFLMKKSSAICNIYDLQTCVLSVNNKLSRLEQLLYSKVNFFKKSASSPSLFTYLVTVGNRLLSVTTTTNTVATLYKHLASILKVDDNSFLLYQNSKILHKGSCNIIQPNTNVVLYCHFKLNAGARSTAEQAHPGKKCAKCAKCNSTSSIRWYHKVNKDADFLSCLQHKFGLSQNSCLCSKCHVFIEKSVNGKRSCSDKRKFQLQDCIVCGNVGHHSCFVENIKLFESKFSVSHCQHEVTLCNDHFKNWNKIKIARCEMPDCGIVLKERVRHMTEYHCRLIMEHFKVHDDYPFFTLNTEHDLCRKCYDKLFHISKSCDTSHVLSDSSHLQGIMNEHKIKFSDMKKNMSTPNYKELALIHTIIYVAENLIEQRYLILSDVRDYFCKFYQQLVFSNSGALCLLEHISNSWLKLELSRHFSSHWSLTTLKNDGKVSKVCGTLIVRSGCDLQNCMHEVINQNETKIKKLNIEIEQLKEQLKDAKSCDSKCNANLKLFDSLMLVSSHLRDKLASQTQTISECFDETSLSKFTLDDVVSTIDPHIWNLMFIMMSSNHDYSEFTRSPIDWDTSYMGFYDKSSFPKHTKFIRLLYNTCHQMFTASDGATKFPFHILLGDSIQANGGSKTLTEILNRLGIISSLKSNKNNMQSVTSDKILHKFVNDLIQDAWAIASLDNVDFDQPNAHFNNQKRGLHATSMQALYPDTSIKLHPDEIITDVNDTLQYDVEEMFKDFSTNDVLFLNSNETKALCNMQNDVFGYMTEKECASQPYLLGNLKARMSKFCNINTEKGKAVYLGVIDEPCDCHLTVKNVLERFYDIFQIGQKIKYLLVVGDGKTYDILCKLKQEYPKELAWCIAYPGDWHLLKNTQPVLFKAYLGAGLKEIAEETFKSDGLLHSLISCKNFKRCNRFILCVWEAFYRFQLQQFFANDENELGNHSFSYDDMKQFVIEHINSVAGMTDFDILKDLRSKFLDRLSNTGLQGRFQNYCKQMCELDDTFKFWHHFVHRDAFGYVCLYLSIRSTNWHLRVASIKLLAPLYHAFDRPTYLRLVAKHLSDLLIMPKPLLHHLTNGGFASTITGLEWKRLAFDECHESLINLDLKTFVRRPNMEYLNRSAIYLPYQAACQQNLYSVTTPPLLSLKDTIPLSQYKLDEIICQKYLAKVTTSNVFCCTQENRGIFKLFHPEIKAEGPLYYDMTNFYNIGKKSIEDFISHRILLLPSTKAPVKRKLLRTMSDTKTVKGNVRSTEQDSKTVSMCMLKQISHSIKTGQPIKNFEQFISNPRAICNADGSMYHTDTK